MKISEPLKRIELSQLLKPAEQLKILICENISLQMSNRILPTLATSNDYLSVGNAVRIATRNGELSLAEPKLSYFEFNEVMKAFLMTTSLVPFRTKNVIEDFATIFSPIQSALKKASLLKNEIDYVLFIGGSSKNPYVQDALKEYFKESQLLIPRDLQTHVSAGASIHSLIYNGFNKNIIQPITSEPFLVITNDHTPKVILRAGTHIPCDLIIVDDLVTSFDGQQAIELPICLGNVNKILYNIKIVSSSKDGFQKHPCKT
ncbi:MAG: Hsp70 family protein [Bacteroidetes bacterium]|nr:Hsp70 family protein [Bacteroidota bacterium]